MPYLTQKRIRWRKYLTLKAERLKKAQRGENIQVANLVTFKNSLCPLWLNFKIPNRRSP